MMCHMKPFRHFIFFVFFRKFDTKRCITHHQFFTQRKCLKSLKKKIGIFRHFFTSMPKIPKKTQFIYKRMPKIPKIAVCLKPPFPYRRERGWIRIYAYLGILSSLNNSSELGLINKVRWSK